MMALTSGKTGECSPLEGAIRLVLILALTGVTLVTSQERK